MGYLNTNYESSRSSWHFAMNRNEREHKHLQSFLDLQVINRHEAYQVLIGTVRKYLMKGF